MLLEQILPRLRAGEKIRRRSGNRDVVMLLKNATTRQLEDLLADDWEVVQEPKKMRTMYLWLTRFRDESFKITKELFENEEQLIAYYTSFGGPRPSDLIRLDWSKTEVPE